MSQQSKHRNAAHQSAVSDILQARRKALEWLVKLSIADNVDWSSPFINGNPTRFKQHPQRPAHAYTLLYAYNVANKAYWPKEKNLFVDELEVPTGGTYYANVPIQSEYTIYTERGDPDSVPIRLRDIETTTETITLETLNHRWENRQVTLYIESDSPYYETQQVTRQVDLWLPPKAISLAFKQLDELAGSLNFLAEPKDELPVWGFEEVDIDEHNTT